MRALATVLAIVMIISALTGCSKVPIQTDEVDEITAISPIGGPLADSVLIIVWKDDNGDSRFSLFDGNTNVSPSQISTSDAVFSSLAELNSVLAEYPQDSIYEVNIKHTMDFSKDEMDGISDSIAVPSGNYFKTTGLYSH